MVRRFLIKVLVSALALWAADYFGRAFRGRRHHGLPYRGAGVGHAEHLYPSGFETAYPTAYPVVTGFIHGRHQRSYSVVSPRITTAVSITGLWTLLWATLIVSVVNMLFEPNTDK